VNHWFILLPCTWYGIIKLSEILTKFAIGVTVQENKMTYGSCVKCFSLLKSCRVVKYANSMWNVVSCYVFSCMICMKWRHIGWSCKSVCPCGSTWELFGWNLVRMLCHWVSP
jgi:hypothetical protein